MNALDLLRLYHRLFGRIAPAFVAAGARNRFLRARRLPAPQREIAVLQGSRVRRLHDGTTVMRWGESGPMLLLMHGMEGRPTQFHALIEASLARGYQIVAPWGAGHGESAMGEAHPVSFARNVLATAEAYPDLYAAIGHSMGGAAIAAALECGLPAQRVALIGSPTAMRHVLERFAAYVHLPSSATGHFIAAVERRVGMPVDELDVTLHHWPTQLPAMIVHDRGDPMVPFSEAERLKDRFPAFRLLATSGLGHHRILRDAATIDALLAFIGRPIASRMRAA